MKLFAIRAAMRVLSWVPPRLAEHLAPALAALVWYSVPRLRRTTRINLSACFPEMSPEERIKIGRASMVHYARGIFEAGMLWYWPLEKIYGLFDEAQGLEFMDDAIRAQKGFIIAAPHWGSWEMLNLFLNSRNNAAILFKPGKFPELDQELKEKRSRGGAEMVPANSRGIKRMYSLLKEGFFVALLPDQEPTGGSGAFAPFYGVEALTGVLLPRMAQNTGAPVIFSVCERLKGGRYRVHFFKCDEAIYSNDMREALTAVNRGIERCIEVDIEQYLWAYKRFRHRPEGEPSLYRRT